MFEHRNDADRDRPAEMSGFHRRLQLLWRASVGLSGGLLLASIGCAGASASSDLQGPGEDATPIVRKPVAGPASGSGMRPLSLDVRRQRAGPLVVQRGDLDRVLNAGPGVLLQHVPLEPVFGSNRRFRGFRIVSLWRDDPRVRRYGVRPGDVVLEINGQPIHTPDQLLAVFRLLRNAVELRLRLSRSGTKLNLRWPIVDQPVDPPVVTDPAIDE